MKPSLVAFEETATIEVYSIGQAELFAAGRDQKVLPTTWGAL
jgi:hypothetical protein